VRLALDDRLHQGVVLGGDVAPGEVAVLGAAPGGGVVHLLEGAVLAHPGVGEAVDDDHLVAGRLGLVDGLHVPLGVEAGEVADVELELVGVEAGRAVLGVDHGDLRPEAGGDGQGE
jgi:hypothetical protein